MGLLLATALMSATPDPLETGRQYTSWFYAGETAKLWERFTPEMKQAIGTVEGLAQFREQVRSQAGEETEVVSEQVTPSPPLQVYSRTVKVSKAPMPILVQWTLDASGNSGNTSEPHLHYHLQTTERFGGGEGLPAQFLDYFADGKKVERGEPRRGQTVRMK